MKKIPLYRLIPTVVGHARVSDGDFKRLNAFQWWAWECGRSRYARRFAKKYKATVLMHNMICPGTGDDVHHKDNDGWNNLRENLERLARAAHAQFLRRKRTGASSKYVGVYWHAQTNAWRSEIKIAGKKKYLGTFKTELSAYRAYLKAKKHYAKS